jgi:putative ABC transport system permease protein
MLRLAGLFRQRQRAEEICQELESHLQLHFDDNMRLGLSATEARRDALARLGGIEAVKEQQRDRAGVPFLQHLARDVRYGTRVLRRNPTFTAIAIVTLALGIGANASIFTLVNAVLLRPLPYEDSARLVMIWSMQSDDGVGREVSASYPDFESWRDETRSFEHVAALTSRSVTLGGADLAELVPAVQTTTHFFRVLGVTALAGRVFDDSDTQPEAPPVAILSDAAWKRQFGGRGDIIGTTIVVNQRPHVVVGVVPSAMHFIPTEVEQVYTLLPRETNREHGYLRVIGRLRPGIPISAAQAELDVIARRTAAAFPRTHAGTGARIVSLADSVGAPVRDGLLILLAMVGAVLLIACTNVANLLLARNAARQHELGLRISLGAGRARIVQQLLTESVLLAVAGGAAGLVIAPVLTDALVGMLGVSVRLPRIEGVAVDRTVVLFTFAVSIGAGLLFGVAPALLVAPSALQASMREAGRGIAGSRAGQRMRTALVVIETAVALVLLATGAMLGRSFLELRATPSGFVSDNVLAVGIRLPASLAPGAPREAFFEELRSRLEALPAVRSAGFVSNLPMAGGRDTLQFRLTDQPAAKPVSANFNVASPGYFRTLNVPVIAGREFARTDDASAEPVIVVNETAARRFWPGRPPIGRQISLPESPVALKVIGVTGDVRQSDLGSAPRPEIFLCALQPGPDWPSFVLVVKTLAEPIDLLPDVRASLRAVERGVAISRTGTMADVVAGRLAEPRAYTILLGAFAALALMLAAVGLYGVIAYSVTQRTREMGIRLALGSTPAALVASMLRTGATLTAAGIVMGLAAAYAATQSIARLLPNVRGGDPLTLISVAALMLLVGSLASYLPARRAARVDPLAALRVE